MRTHKLMLHRLIVIWVVMSMLIVQASPTLAVVQQAVIDIQEQLSGVFALPPTAYTPTAPLTIDDRIYPVQEEFPVVIPTSTPTPMPTATFTPTPTTTPSTPTPTPTEDPVDGGVHATRILDYRNSIQYMDRILGPHDTTIDTSKEAVLYGGSCIVLGFDGVVLVPENIEIWLKGLFYRGPANSTTVNVQFSDKYLSCDDTRWYSFPTDSDLKGTEHPHGIEYGGHIPRDAWFNAQRNIPDFHINAIRSIRLETTTGIAPIDSVTINGGTFVFEFYLGNEPTVGEPDCGECMDSDTHLQAQEEVGLPIDVNSGTYTYGNDDITTQGLIEPLTFRRSYINGTDLDNFFRSDTGSFGLGWTHNYYSRIITYTTFESSSDALKSGNANPNTVPQITQTYRAIFMAILAYVSAYNAHYHLEPGDAGFLTVDDVMNYLANSDLTFANNDPPGFDFDEDVVEFTQEFIPYKVFIARTGSIHTMTMDGEPQNGIQKWKFESGFLAEAEEYLVENGITLNYVGGTITGVRMRIILRNQTVQYYDDRGQLVAISQRHIGTETAFNNGLLLPQTLLHPTILTYEGFGGGGKRLASIQSGINALSFDYYDNNPQIESDLRISSIKEIVSGNFTGRVVNYEYPTVQDDAGKTYKLSLKGFRDFNNHRWTYHYVDIFGEPGKTYYERYVVNSVVEEQTNSDVIIAYPRLAVVKNPYEQIVEETTFCSYDIFSAITQFAGMNLNLMREVRYNAITGQTVTTAPKDCTAGRAYKQYNGAGELTLQIDYSFKDIVPHNMVMVTDGIGYVRRYTYENGVISSIEQSLQQRIWSVSESTWVAWTSSGWRPQSTAGFASGATWIPLETTTYTDNYRPLTQTDERGNTSSYLWSPNGDNFVRETVSGNLMGSVITGTNIYNDAFNRVETSVDALNHVSTYQYHPSIFSLPIEISQTRVDIEGQPASNDTITSTYTYTSDGLLDTMITDDNMVTCYQYNLQKQRTVIIVNCGSSPSYITEFMYDRSGRLVGVQAPDGTVTAMLYDGGSNVIRMIQNYTGTLDGDSDYLVSDAEMSAVANFDCQNSQGNSSNICTQYAYDQAGRLTHSIDSLNRATQYYYDAVGRVVYEVLNDTYSDEQTTFTPPSSTSPTTNVWTQYQYDVRGNVIAVIIPTDSGNRTDRICYDEQSRVVGYVQNYVPIDSQNPCTWQITQPSLNNDTNLVTRYQYNLGTQKEVAQLVTDPLGRKTLYCADALNRTTRVIENVTSGYLIASELNIICERTRSQIATTEDTNRVSDIVYDNAGNIQQTTDSTNRTTRFYYDQFNRVVAQVVNFSNREQDFSSNDTANDIITKYYYDDSGNLEAVVDSKARLTWMCYDGLNRNTRTITNFYVNSSINIIFDFANNADYYNEIGYGTTQADLRDIACGLTATTANSAPDTNIITDVSYDNLGRPTIITYWNFDMPYHTHIFYDGLSRITQTIENYDNGIADVADVDKDIITQYTYDRLGNLITVVTPNNLTTLYQYDALNRQTGVIYNYVNGDAVDSDTNITETITYDVLGRVRQTQNAEGVITTFNYDNADRLISYTNTVDSFTISTNYLYDVGGRLVRVANPLGNSTIYTYDQMNRQTSTISPSGFVSRFEYDYAGRVQRQIDAGNRATSYQYDALNRVTRVVENSENSASVLNDGSIQTLYEYDVVGNLLQVTAPSNAVITYTYDRLDRPIAYDGLGSALTSWQTDYDQFGRILAITAPDTTQTTYSYDNLHRLTGVNYASAPDVSYVYDRLGRRTSMDDGVGTTTYAYDDMNRITNVATPNTSVGYAYDRLGRRTQLTMDNDTTVRGGEKSISYTYDTINRLKSVTGWEGANHITEYQYDIASRLTKMAMPNGVNAQYEYDADNRLVALAYLKPQSLETDVYAYEYNNVGMRTATNEATYNLITSLIPNRELQEELARLVAEDETGDILYVMPSSTACGDDCFRVDVVAMVRPDNNAQAAPVEVSDYVDFKLTYTNPQEASTTVEGQGLTVQALPRQFTSSATDENFSKLVYERIAPMVYRAYDNVLTLIFGDNYTPQIILEENFELFMALLGTGQSTQTSQITQRIEYTYDGMYRLREAVYKLNGETTQTYTYGYDVLGSRTSETITIPSETPVTRAFNYNNSGQIDQTGFDYDTKGNLVTDGVYTYNYDDANRLISIGDSTNTNTLSTYTYNGDGDRVSQTYGANTTHYMLDVNSRLTQVLGEFQAGDETWYLHGLDIIGQQNSADGWAYFGYDALGSVRTIYDGNGALAYVNEYDPYGQVIYSEAVGNSTVTSSLGFAGEQTDDSGLVYLRARYMNPETGAFLSTDPIHGMVGMSMTWNPYPYALGNPVHYTDPSGESPFWWALGIGFALGTLNAINNLNKQRNDPLCRDPLDCVDWNDVFKSWWEGFTFGASWTMLAWAFVFGGTINFGASPLAFGAMGGLLGAMESIWKQTDSAIRDGRADNFFDALGEVNWGEVISGAGVGATAGVLLSLGRGNIFANGAWFGLGGYIVGNVLYNLRKDEDSRVPISIRDGSISTILTSFQSFIDSRILGDESRPILSIRRALLFLTGAGTSVAYSYLTDDDPLQNEGETELIGLYGLSNWLLGGWSGLSDALGGGVNGFINAISNDLDNR